VLGVSSPKTRRAEDFTGVLAAPYAVAASW